MRKKKILITLITIISLVCGTLTRISAYADFDPIKSRGNFVLGGGEMSIYASDLDYLQSEVQALYDELPSVIEIDASAVGTARKDSIQSKGIIDYGNGTVVLDSSDFNLLADEIDSLESEYKANAVAALNDIGTYFMIDGSITHNQGEETLPYQYANILSLDLICVGIRQSQSVDHLEAAPAIADNISTGAAAWVDGQCIIGTGKDVNDAYDRGYDEGSADGYRQGYADGYADHVPDDARIEYIYHEHAGNSGLDIIPDGHVYYSLDNPGGCYVGSHTHNKTGMCPSKQESCPGYLIIYGENTEIVKCDYCGNRFFPNEEPRHYYGEKCPLSITVYTCGSPVNTWNIGCGKSTSTIIGATIVWVD